MRKGRIKSQKGRTEDRQKKWKTHNKIDKNTTENNEQNRNKKIQKNENKLNILMRCWLSIETELVLEVTLSCVNNFRVKMCSDTSRTECK